MTRYSDPFQNELNGLPLDPVVDCTTVLSEPFDNFTDAPWTQNSVAILAGRTGTAFRTNAAGDFARFDLPVAAESAHVTVGFAWKTTLIGISNIALDFLSDGATTQHIQLSCTSAGINVTRGPFTGIAAALSPAAITMVANTWYYIEVQVYLHDTLGSVTVRVDGVERGAATNVDTRNGGTADVFDAVRIRGSNGADQFFDDLYLNTGADCAFLGDPNPPPVPVTGSIATTFAFTAPATGSKVAKGAASTTFAFAALASGSKVAKGSVSTTFAFTAPAAGDPVVPGVGSIATTFAFTAPASGTKTAKGAASTTFAFSAPASGTKIAKGSASTTFAFSAPIVVSKRGSISTTFAFSAPIVVSKRGSISTTFAFTAPIEVSDQVGLLTSTSTLFPDRVGVTVGDAATAGHTVIAGTSTGAGVLTGDYAFRGQYGLDLSVPTPGAIADGAGWVTLASWGDFTLRLRRDISTTYRVRVDHLTAATEATYAAGQLQLANGRWSLGLGVTRDATTGAISLWRSDDSWLSWSEIPLAESTIVAGALSDSGGDDLVILGGDLSDGNWISVFQAQWGATDDINALDANEVAAWNYGANFTGDVAADAKAWAFGADAAFADASSSSTVATDIAWTINADTLATATAPAGTSAAYTADLTPQWEQGPGASIWSSPIAFTSNSQFAVSIGAALVVPGLPSSPGSGGAPSTPGAPGAPGTLRENDGTPEPYQVRIVDMAGVVLHELPNAAVGPITWSLNEAESFSFTMPALDPLVSNITATDTEVQVWRGDRLLVWGVVVRPLVSGSRIDYQCRGLAWYFTKRFVGGPRRNYLENASFETSGGWFYGAAPTEDPANLNPSNYEAEVTSQRSVAGFPGRSQRLWSNDQMDFGISAFQFIFHEIDSALWPDGIKWTASAWVYIPSDEWGFYDADADKKIGERNAAYNWGGESAPFGLHLGRFSTTSSEEQDIVEESYPEVYEISVAGLTDELPRDQWVRIETSLVQPAPEGGGRRTDWIQVELHAPLGAVYYDEVSLTRNERLFYDDVAQEAILFSLVEHAQDTAYGKSDLNIGFAAAPITNITRTRSYEFFNREFISDAIDEFTTLWNGCDWSVETTATQRLFSPWFPMKGMRRPAQALTLGVNIASVTIADDGEQIVNRAVVRSDAGGTGSSREEAIGTNTAGFASGLVLEGVFNAAPESPLDSLEGQLQQALRQKRTARIPTLTTHDNVALILFGQVLTGDIVPVDVVYGGVSLQGDFRVMALTLNPSDETMNFVVNPFSDADDPLVDLDVMV